jgi:hypothetical protein
MRGTSRSRMAWFMAEKSAPSSRQAFQAAATWR